MTSSVNAQGLCWTASAPISAMLVATTTSGRPRIADGRRRHSEGSSCSEMAAVTSTTARTSAPSMAAYVASQSRGWASPAPGRARVPNTWMATVAWRLISTVLNASFVPRWRRSSARPTAPPTVRARTTRTGAMVNSARTIGISVTLMAWPPRRTRKWMAKPSVMQNITSSTGGHSMLAPRFGPGIPPLNSSVPLTVRAAAPSRMLSAATRLSGRDHHRRYPAEVSPVFGSVRRFIAVLGLLQARGELVAHCQVVELQLQPLHVRADHVRADHVRADQVRACQKLPDQVRADQLVDDQVRVAHDEPLQSGPAQALPFHTPP